jgi:hypothetical protein
MFFEGTVVSLLCAVNFDTIPQRINEEGSLWLLRLAQCATPHTTDFSMTAPEEVFNKQLI